MSGGTEGDGTDDPRVAAPAEAPERFAFGAHRKSVPELQQGNGAMQRVTVFVYDPAKVQIGGAHLAARAVGTSEVRTGRADGYSIAVTQHAGVGYAMASDMDPESSASLMAVVDHGD